MALLLGAAPARCGLASAPIHAELTGRRAAAPGQAFAAAPYQQRSRRSGRAARTAALPAAAAAAVGSETDQGLRELTQDDFRSYLEGAGERLVVVDFYTDWCGPCKVMLPVLEQMAGELAGRADIVKFNCNAKNKELGRELNIRVAPTFHLYKRGNKVAEMTGAKVEDLKKLIDQNI